MLLRGRGASRSFAGMRVEAVEKIPRRAEGPGAAATDAAAGLAIKSFRAAMESEDSLFALQEPLEGRGAEAAASGHVFSGDIVLGFKQAELGKQRSLHFLLVEKLIELLKEAGSQETLEAKLCLRAGSRENAELKESVLCIRLSGKGDSPEQAMLRWGLGLAHLQQAVLFTSRHLRLHLTQSGH